MEIITAKFTITTPMFMSGANQKQVEIRAASIKGVIRFWWRALNYAKDETLSALKDREETIFGSTKRQAPVRFIIESNRSSLSSNNLGAVPGWLDSNKNGCFYLGYGVMDYNGKLQHPCIKHNQNFTLKLVSNNKIDSSLIDAVQLFGLIGGAGAKSRKGYGSVSLVELFKKGEDFSCPKNKEEYKLRLGELLGQTDAFAIPSNQSFTAFSKEARIYLLLSGSSSIDILNGYGKTMQLCRSWGRYGKLPNSKSAEQNFKKDHDWFKNENSFRTTHPKFHPERALFGLPHNYYSQGTAPESVKPVAYERRASPLFFHIHQLSDNEFIGVSILLPAQFLPDKEGGNIFAGGDKNVQEKNYDILTSRFLEGKRGSRDSKTSEDYFPGWEIIWPGKQEKQS